MHPNLVKIIKECIEEVLKENLSEGFDPTSQGPNPAQENPYPAWNAQMRKLEETDPHGRYAQEAGAGQFDPRTFGLNEMRGNEVNIERQCPYCGQITDVVIEVESPSDYYTSNDCEHCGKDVGAVSDPAFDQKVMDAVNDYFGGRAEYMKDTRGDR
jgi:hypothetical protein